MHSLQVNNVFLKHKNAKFIVLTDKVSILQKLLHSQLKLQAKAKANAFAKAAKAFALYYLNWQADWQGKDTEEIFFFLKRKLYFFLHSSKTGVPFVAIT